MIIRVVPLGAHKPLAEYALCQSPYGKCIVATTEQSLCWLSFCGADLQQNIAELALFWGEDNIVMNQNSVENFSRKIFSTQGDVDVVLCGSALQIDVWRALCEIAPGQRCSYGDIATKIGRAKAVRAVASAIGKNNISYVVPCHRVVRADGTLGGYRWGIEIKNAMLLKESTK